MQKAAAFESLVVHAGWLRRFAIALVRDADVAEDVVQDTLVAAWQHPAPADGATRSWLARVARNRAHDRRRSEDRRGAREAAVTPGAATAGSETGTAPSPEALVGDLQIHRTLAQEVSALAEPYREVVILRHYEGLDAAAIARRLGVPAGTVRWRLKEGLDRVRVRLDQRHGGDRRNWLAALAPLLPPGFAGPAGGAGAAVVAVPGSAGKLVGLVAVLVIGGTLAAWLLFRAVPSPSPSRIAASRSELGVPAAASASRTAPIVQPAPRLQPAVPTSPNEAGRASDDPVPSNPETLVRQMLGAVAAKSYDEFLRYAGDIFKARLDKTAFEQVSEDLGPSLRQGYSLEALGPLWQHGHTVHLWKLSRPGEDDHLIRLGIKDGRVSGFIIQ